MPKYHLPADEVRRIRRSLGETQAEFAKRLCVDAVTVARWETDQRKCTGLYAKTIAELDQTNSLLTKGKKDMEGKQELIRSIELNEIFSLKNELKPIFKFLDKEVPLEDRAKNLETYQIFFNDTVYRYNKLFDGVCNARLYEGIANFCIIGLSKDDFFYSTTATEYQREKLFNSYEAICEAAKELDSNISIVSFLPKDIGMMLFQIKYTLNELLVETQIEAGDISIIKFFRSLVEFTWAERNARKFLPIPEKVSFRFLSFLFNQPIKILLPELDDSSQLEALRKC